MYHSSENFKTTNATFRIPIVSLVFRQVTVLFIESYKQQNFRIKDLSSSDFTATT
jgi:hypothetical protein